MAAIPSPFAPMGRSYTLPAHGRDPIPIRAHGALLHTTGPWPRSHPHSRPWGAPTHYQSLVGAGHARDRAHGALLQPHCIPQRIIPYRIHNARTQRIRDNVPGDPEQIVIFANCAIKKTALPNIPHPSGRRVDVSRRTRLNDTHTIRERPVSD